MVCLLSFNYTDIPIKNSVFRMQSAVNTTRTKIKFHRARSRPTIFLDTLPATFNR